VPDIYPAGGEKQLIRTLTGAEVPTHSLPIDVGVVMHNVATAVAAADAVLRGLPLTERMVTVTGEVPQPVNLRVPVGTPIRHLLEAAGGQMPGTRVILGGPMMGVAIDNLDVPVVKTTNAVIVIREPPAVTAMPCIRCGECVDVCPAQLQPQALYEFVRAGDWDGAQDYHLFDCIECGACAYVCPSRLPLVHYYRWGKVTIDASDRAQGRADELRERHRAHVARGTLPDFPEDGEGFQVSGDAVHGINDTAAEAGQSAALTVQQEIAAARERVRARRAALSPARTGTTASSNGDEPSGGPRQ
jgi:electron transport complex protein RnfC